MVQEYYCTFITSIDRENLYGLANAAHYLGIDPLLDLCSARIASFIMDSTMEEISANLGIVFDPLDTAEINEELEKEDAEMKEMKEMYKKMRGASLGRRRKMAAHDAAAQIAHALQQGSKPWMRSKFSLLGQGRAGKTAFANAIAGKRFEETASTVGINQLTCDVKYINASGASHCGQEWGEGTKNLREFEAALAEILAGKQRAVRAEGDSSSKEVKSSGAIHIYMETVCEPFVRSADSGESSIFMADTDDAEQNSVELADTSAVKPVSSASSSGIPKQHAALPAERAVTSAGQVAHAAPDLGTFNACVAKTAPAASSKPEIDEEMVMKMLANMHDTESGLMVSLFDFGGQSVFEVIHHLFLTRNGVYALVFNMEWLLTEGQDKERALRFMRSWLSSIAVHTFNKTTLMTAPIMIVGTRLDIVRSPAAHEKISTILHEHLSDNLAWRSVVGNKDGMDSNGRAFQWFFPVDNKLGKQDAAMKHLISIVTEIIERAEYTHKEVPLTWFKAIDLIAESGKDCLLLQEVAATADKCNVSEKEVPLLLSFLNDVGHLMWLDEPGLRDVVVLDPVSYLVVPATTIICKLSPDHEDTTHHFLDSHRECERMHKREWMQLKHEGLLTVKLLPILWRQYQQQSETLQMLMVKFGFLVPLRIDVEGPVTQYLVPTLLKPAPLHDANVADWTDLSVASCYFVFTLSEELVQSSTVTEAELKGEGFLPGGMFERIVGKALSWSQDTAAGCTYDLKSALLYKDVAVLAFGRQRFRLVHCVDIHCVRVDVEGSHPIGVQHKLQDFIMRIIDECMKPLRCFPAVVFQSADGEAKAVGTSLVNGIQSYELLIPIKQLHKTCKGESILMRKGGRALITRLEVKSKYGQWLQLYDLRERYDVFLSYRCGRYDSEFTEQLFDVFTNLSVGAQSRAVEVFLDRKRMQMGRPVLTDTCAALVHTLVVVPVVSAAALGRMMQHDPSQSDNVLLEWIVILESFAAGNILKVLPILFGKRSGAGFRGVQIADFLADGIMDALPKIAPTATLTQVFELLRVNGIKPSDRMESYTVHSVVNALLDFLPYKASGGARRVVGAFAVKVVSLLNDCGDAALDAVAASGVRPVDFDPKRTQGTNLSLKQADLAAVAELIVAKIDGVQNKLEMIDLKLDQVLLQLKTRFDALSSCTVEIAESLRSEIIQGGLQTQQVLPDMLAAIEDAQQRLLRTAPDGQQNPDVMLACIGSLQSGIESAVSRALSTSGREAFRAMDARLQENFNRLSIEFQAHVQEQRMNNTHAAQQGEALCSRLEASLSNMRCSLRAVQGDLGKQIAAVLADNKELNSMLRTLIANVHDLPTLAIILPEVSTSWKNKVNPMRLVRDQYRLYFLCSHTHQIAPCGPNGQGYPICVTKQWVVKAAPVLRVGLVLVKVALLASGLPLPVPDLSSVLVGSKMHAQYLDAALQLVARPPDGTLDVADFAMQQALDLVDAHDYADLLESQSAEGSKKAYDAIKYIMDMNKFNISGTCGLRQVTHGRTAWVLDSDETERDWRNAIESAK